jgi:acetolactate synthase-1/2/3 large subunit
MVRQWQELFFEKRYSFTEIFSPDFVKVADAYGIPGQLVNTRKELDDALQKMVDAKGPYLLEIMVEKEDNIFPMVPAGASVSDIMLCAEDAK